MTPIAKPQIKKITPFDAAGDHEIWISWSGSRACANRILIYDNETNQTVFDHKVSSYILRHTIPARTLSNGRKYVIQAQVFSADNIPSALSDKILFYTFETPDFYFEDIPDGSVIDNSSFAASVHYYSSDWEDLGKYVFSLYDASKKLLLESSELTDAVHISYTYQGLDNNTAYYIRCTGVTVNGMELDTGYIGITVRFENPNHYARIYATPLPSQGCIQVASNLVIIQYNGTDSFRYIDGMIDLRDSSIFYDRGFSVRDDFTLLLRGMNLWQTADILKMRNGHTELTLSSRIYTDGTLRFRLLVPNGVGHYLLYSDPQVFDPTDLITIALRRINNIYQLEVFTEPGDAAEGDMWYGTERPSRLLMHDNDAWIDTVESTYVVDRDFCTVYLNGAEPLNTILNDLWLGGD
ncbi:MAG: hypothetical protein K2O97_12515 [Acetatifactor sp.]|nr:hypothetical protein [Acetatifactor sp.]